MPVTPAHLQYPEPKQIVPQPPKVELSFFERAANKVSRLFSRSNNNSAGQTSAVQATVSRASVTVVGTPPASSVSSPRGSMVSPGRRSSIIVSGSQPAEEIVKSAAITEILIPRTSLTSVPMAPAGRSSIIGNKPQITEKPTIVASEGTFAQQAPLPNPRFIISMSFFSTNMPAEFIENLAKDSPYLETLDLTDCYLNFAAMSAIFKQMVALKNLSLASCGCYDPIFEHAMTEQINLRTINLSGCRGITLQGITVIAKNCPDLTSINLSGCSVDESAVTLLLAHCKNLTRENIIR